MKGSIKTLRSFKKLSESPLYSMDYTADYQLDRLLKMGAGSDTQFANNVCKINQITVVYWHTCNPFRTSPFHHYGARHNDSILYRN